MAKQVASAAEPMSSEDMEKAAEEILTTSSDAAHSSYAQAPQDREAQDNPPPGPQVEQTRGKPSESS